MSDVTVGRRLARVYAWTVVTLRHPIVLAWIAGLVASFVVLPPLSGSSSAPLDDIVPSSSKALAAQRHALQLFGSTVSTDTLVVDRDPHGLTRAGVAAQARRALAVTRGQGPSALRGVHTALPIVNAPVPGVHWRERNTATLTYLFIDPHLSLVDRNRLAHRYAGGLGRLRPGEARGVTGAGPARLEQFRQIDAALPWIELATVLVIVGIVALYFRSPGAPLVTLGTAGVAYLIAVRVLAWAGERLGVSVPSEIQPVLIVLLVGVVTDYTVFLMSEMRRRLRQGDPPVIAARRATAKVGPLVLAAGLLIAGGAASLLAGRMQFFRVFGPGLAVSALVVTLACLTLVPALMAMCGRWLFGRRAVASGSAPPPAEPARPRAGGARRRLWFGRVVGALRASRRTARQEGRSVRVTFIVRLLATRPAAALVAATCLAALVVAAAGLRSLDFAVSFVPSLPKDTEVRRAGDAAATAFEPGVVAPADIIVERPGIDARPAALVRLQRLIARQPGIGQVLGPAQAVGPARRFVVSRPGAVRYVALMRDEPTGARAIGALGRLQARMPGLERAAGLPVGRVSYAGETALARETVRSLVHDLWRVALATAVVMLVLLAIAMRALVAPVLLLTASALACAAALGVTARLLGPLLGAPSLIYYVPLVGGVMLVGLGSDYNVLIAGRIRDQMRRRRTPDAIAVAAPAASRAITVAGITLAATFALLAFVPLLPFRQLALLMALGVLIDALFVRPLLIPALVAVAGRATWWPGRLRHTGSARTFHRELARRLGRDRAFAADLSGATLTTLAERIPGHEAQELARVLPEELARLLLRGEHAQTFSRDEFVARVARRARTGTREAAHDAPAVVSLLAARLADGELEYLRATLPGDFDWLFGDVPPPEASATAVATG